MTDGFINLGKFAWETLKSAIQNPTILTAAITAIGIAGIVYLIKKRPG